MIWLANAFSINMLPDAGGTVRFTPLTVDDARELLTSGFTSAVGHADTAAVMANLLGLEIPVNRANVRLKIHDLLIVGQYVGPRLPEGTTQLPEGAQINFYRVDLIC